jgi:hypothetical protein
MCISLKSLGLAMIMKDVAEYRPEIDEQSNRNPTFGLRDCHKVSLTQGPHHPRNFFLDGFLYDERNGLGCSLSRNSLSFCVSSCQELVWFHGEPVAIRSCLSTMPKAGKESMPQYLSFDVLLSRITPRGSLLQRSPERYLIFSLSQIRGCCFTSFETQARRP